MPEFKRKEELYTISWPKKPEYIVISGRKVYLPERPPQVEMVNYGLPVKDQKFRREPVPKDILYWDQKDIDEFVEAQWHIRRNGYWILIKGQEFYFPGAYVVFLQYWICEFGSHPSFRKSGLDFFQYWWSVELDPDCFGMLVVKPRRIGATESALFLTWERSTRYVSWNGGILHLNEKGAKRNFARLVKGNAGMPFFFKPFNEGTSDPKGGSLMFKIPAEKITRKMVNDGRFHQATETKGIESEIYVEPAVTLAFDGVRLGTYYGDEFGKAKSKRLNILDQWENIKRVTSLNNGAKIIGKSILTSTIEEVETAEGAEVFTVDIVRKLVNDSTTFMPDSRRTVSGLAFFFYSYLDAADTDEWGFHKVEEAKKIRDEKIALYRKEKMWDKLLSTYRKEPATIEEALSSPMGEAIFYPELCEERLRQMDAGINKLGKPQEQRGVYGRLKWVNNIFGGKVEWVPSPKNREDKFYVSQHPGPLANKKIIVKGKPYPGNMGYYRMGLDPFEASKVEGKGSDGAFTIKKLLNLSLETNADIITDKNGKVLNPWDMLTNQIVLDYKWRCESIHEFYEDAYMACVYFGVAAFAETNKRGFNEWMELNGLDYYLQDTPAMVQASSSRAKGQKGKAATAGTINQYIAALKGHIYEFIWCCHHPRVIKDWSLFTVKTRTLRDLSVATGYTELAELDTRYEEKKEEEDRWEPVFTNYN